MGKMGEGGEGETCGARVIMLREVGFRV